MSDTFERPFATESEGVLLSLVEDYRAEMFAAARDGCEVRRQMAADDLALVRAEIAHRQSDARDAVCVDDHCNECGEYERECSCCSGPSGNEVAS